MAHFKIEGPGQREPSPHVWRRIVGIAHSPLTLRADWQRQLRMCRKDLGFQSVRFHDLLSGTQMLVEHSTQR